MALFNVQIQKFLFNEYWINRYIVNADDIGLAADVADDIVEVERSLHIVGVDFTSYRVSDNIPDNDQFIVKQLGVLGTRPSGGGQLMPLFCCFRVDFSVGIGRPSRKYLRGCMLESDQDAGTVIAGSVASVNTLYTTPMLTIGNYVDVDGQAFVAGACNTKVGMHQLRRGSRRRTTPIIPT